MFTSLCILGIHSEWNITVFWLLVFASLLHFVIFAFYSIVM